MSTSLIRVVLTHSRPIPVFPHKQTCRASTGMSQKCPTGDIALAFLSTEEIATKMALSKSPGQYRGLEDFDFLLSIRRLRETGSSSFEDSCVLRKRFTP